MATPDIDNSSCIKNHSPVVMQLDPWWHPHHRDLDYRHEPFNSPDDVRKWHRLGFTQQRFTGEHYDMRREEPDWIDRFRQVIPMQHFSWSVYRMRPGDVLPNHGDTYAAFRRIYQVPESQPISRYIVFLENWQSGHYFELAGVPVLGYQAGCVVRWQDAAPHLAANVGETMRYTLQLTGLESPANQSH